MWELIEFATLIIAYNRGDCKAFAGKLGQLNEALA